MRIGVLTTHKLLTDTVHLENSDISASVPRLPPFILKKRFEMFLEVFAAIPSPKQLYQHQLLLAFYHVLVSKPDLTVAKLALDCILSYKLQCYNTHVDSFKKLMDDSSIRSQLIIFNISPDCDAIEKSIRPDVISLGIRILYGKFSAKVRGGRAARDQSLAWYCVLIIIVIASCFVNTTCI